MNWELRNSEGWATIILQMRDEIMRDEIMRDEIMRVDTVNYTRGKCAPSKGGGSELPCYPLKHSNVTMLP